MSELEILELFAARNERAIKKCEESYGAYCRTISFRILQDEGEVAECVHPQNLGAYLAKITRNLSLNRYRSAHRKKRGADRVSVSLEELAECVPSGETLEQTVEKGRLGKIISGFLRELPKEERVMFVRRYFYMDSVAEVALFLGCSESRVKTTMFRCRKRLQEVLIREEVSI